MGFNFKYFLRKSEDKCLRKENFGEQKAASRIYVSNLLGDNDSVYLINFNNPFDYNEPLKKEIFDKYKELLFKFTEGQGNLNG
ncbi:hypothetical protein V4762_02830 [Thermodesulfobium sp. 4217-1]|uniref:hypothetical protein n=1 Tax=Thermodesulfobium sp. 4217-1 TaxID=3120013 RepID=UPI0032222242